MKKYLLLLCCVLCFSGCIQSTEELDLKADGSGTYNVDLLLPQGTIQLIDMMMGSMMQAMQQAFAQEGEEPAPPPSMVDQMFTKEDIQKKADEGGVQIEFLDFQREQTEEGLDVQYTLSFDDVHQLLSSEVISTGVELIQDETGNWICSVKPDEKKENESKGQMEQLDEFKKSEEFSALDSATQAAMLGALSDLKIEFIIRMPHPITEIDGAFEKIDKNSARLYFEGNIMEDPQLIEKLSGKMNENSRVVWATGSNEIFSITRPKNMQTTNDIVDVNKSVRDVVLTMKNGSIVEGPLLEENDDHVKISISGVPLTYYKDDISSID